MAIRKITNQNTVSIEYQNENGAIVFELNDQPTNLLAQDLTLNRDLVFENKKTGLSKEEIVFYESGPAHGEGGTAFAGATTLQDGRVVFAPNGSPNVGIYDPDAETYTSGPAHNERGTAFAGATTLQDGRVVFAPNGSANVGIYDPDAETYTSGPAHGESVLSAFIGAVTLQDGRVVFAPFDSPNVGIYDPDAGTYTRGPAHEEAANAAFFGATTLQDGRVVFAPNSSDNIGIYDPDTDTYESGPAHGGGTFPFFGATTLQDGRVVFVSWGSDNVGIYDPSTETYTSGPAHGEGDNAFSGATTLQDGRVVLAPHDSANVGIVTLKKAQFLLRNPETGITEGVDYNNLEQFIDTSELNAANLTVPGDEPIDLIGLNNSGDQILLDGTNSVAKYEGNGAFTFGSRNGVVENNSLVLGSNAVSSGSYSVAMGRETQATGNNGAVATGFRSQASGSASFAAGSSAEASGPYSFAAGDDVIASGFFSAATGRDTIASGNSSTAMGNNTEAVGGSSFAIGIFTKTTGISSVSMGRDTISRLYGGIVGGVYNEDYFERNGIRNISSFVNEDRLFAIGVGDDPGFFLNSFDNIGRADGFYVTYRDGTFVRNGLTVERFVTDGNGDYVKTNGVTDVETVFEVDEDGLTNVQTGFKRALRNVTSDTSTTRDDYYIAVDTSGGPVTITLSSQDATEGREIVVYDVAGDSGLNAITVNTEGSETISGSSSQTISTGYDSLTLASDGTNWNVV